MPNFAPIDLNAEANHKRLMTGSIGSINIKESKPLALDNFILTNEFKTSIMHNHDSMQIDCEDHDNAFMADNPFELVDDVKPGFR